MKNMTILGTITVEPKFGLHIDDVCLEMCQIACMFKCIVKSKFNERELLADSNSKPSEMIKSYLEACNHD